MALPPTDIKTGRIWCDNLILIQADTAVDIDDEPDAWPAEGRVVFTPQVQPFLRGSLSDSIVFQRDSYVAPVSNGKMSIRLPATTAPDVEPKGWNYLVSVEIGGMQPITFYCEVAPGSDVNLRSLVPATFPQKGVQILQGPPGPGRGIRSITDTDGDGVATIAYTDDTSASLQLPQGKKGDTGRGVTSITDTDGDGVATVLYTDSTSGSLPLPRGPKGNPGADPAYVSALDNGIVGDGTTDNAAAIQKLMNSLSAGGGGVIVFPYTSAGYKTSLLNVPSNVTLRGLNRVKLIQATASAMLVNMNNAVRPVLEGFTVDPNGLTTSAVVRVSSGTPIAAEGAVIQNCTFQNSGPDLGTSVNYVKVMGDTRNTRIEGNTFNRCIDALMVYANAESVAIRKNRFLEWGNRGIYVLGTSTAATKDLRIEDNYIGPPVDFSTYPNTKPRQPIAIQGGADASGNPVTYHTGLNISGNYVEGNFTNHHLTTDGSALVGGTADMISVQYGSDFLIANNVVRGSGEVGITIAAYARRGTVSGNTVVDSNTTAVAVDGGSGTVAGSTYFPCTDITVTGNTFVNNGHEWGSATSGTVRDGVQSCVFVINGKGVTINGNQCSDDQATHTQKYVVYYNKSSDIRVSSNGLRGMLGVTDPKSVLGTNGAKPIFNGEGTTAYKPAMTTRTNVATVAADPDLTLPVEANGVYLMQSYILYNSSTAADFRFGFTGPSGATMSWTMDSPPLTAAAGATQTMSRSEYALNLDAPGGGVGQTLAITPSGLLIVGATSGNLTFQWGQYTATTDNTIVSAKSWIKLTRIA